MHGLFWDRPSDELQGQCPCSMPSASDHQDTQSAKYDVIVSALLTAQCQASTLERQGPSQARED
eukprot:6474485-Amphidinium_carterae.2